MSGGRLPRRKGYEGERELVHLLPGAYRVPLSGAAGAAGGEFAGDVIWPPLGRGEVKRRKDAWRQLYTWLNGKDWLAVRADRREWLFVLRCRKLIEIVQLAAQRKSEGVGRNEDGA